MTFEQLNMDHTILRAITQDGYEHPTDIQANAIPHLLDGRDMLASAQTGTGKTAAFALPIIHHIQQTFQPTKKRAPKALVLAPTRELALQIKESFDAYSRKNEVKTIAVYGGMPKRNQIVKIKRGVDILIATPGRLLDLMNMKVISLKDIKHLVLDEADQMLDMGFIDDVKKIISNTNEDRQTMLFSATIPSEIAKLSKQILTNPVRVEITPQNTPLETIEQSVFFLKATDKIKLLVDKLSHETLTSALVFVRTKQGVNKITSQLVAAGINAEAIHGDKTQSQRQKTLTKFKKHDIKVLVATDVAARGIDIDALSHVINYDMPQTPQTYLHRIGRTARAGKLGKAYSFCAPAETHLLKAIQKHIEMLIPVETKHDFVVSKPKTATKNAQNPKQYKAKKRSKKENNSNYKTQKSQPDNKPAYPKPNRNAKPVYNEAKEHSTHTELKRGTASLSQGIPSREERKSFSNAKKSNKPFGKKQHKHKKKQRRQKSFA